MTLSNEHWNGLLDEIVDSSAWKKDRKLIKQCRSDNATLDTEPGQLWYFGGNPETGKSTLLFSYLNNQRNGNAYVFPYRFTTGTNLVDQFLLGFREAIVYWLQTRTTIPTPDATLTGEDLQKDVEVLLEKLMTFLQEPASQKHELIIGLDNLERIYDYQTEIQPEIDRLLSIIDSWRRFTYTQIRRFRGEEQEIVRRQIFVLGTAMNINATVQDIDNFCAGDKRVSFIYATENVERFKSHDSVKKLDEHTSSREREMHAYLQAVTPAGAHMPPIGKYGAIEVLTERSRNGGFGAFVKTPTGAGHAFIDDALAVGSKNPVIIDAIAENLNDGIISITDPVTSKSFSVLSTDGSPYLQNRAVLIPMILCFMHELKAPLTVSSLQILSSVRAYPVSSENKFISDVLYDIPQYVEKIALSEANPDGSLAFGWCLKEAFR